MPAPIVPGRTVLHPLHAILLAFPIAWFAAAVAADLTYLNSAEVQWTNFASWAITGALVFGGFVILWAAITLFRNRRSPERRTHLVYLLLLLAMWVLGLVNAFQHSHDAWGSVGAPGVTLSIASALLALAAGWIGYSTTYRRETVR